MDAAKKGDGVRLEREISRMGTMLHSLRMVRDMYGPDVMVKGAGGMVPCFMAIRKTRKKLKELESELLKYPARS